MIRYLADGRIELHDRVTGELMATVPATATDDEREAAFCKWYPPPVRAGLVQAVRRWGRGLLAGPQPPSA